MYTWFHISTVLQLYIYTELYMQHVSYAYNTLIYTYVEPWKRGTVYI